MCNIPVMCIFLFTPLKLILHHPRSLLTPLCPQGSFNFPEHYCFSKRELSITYILLFSQIKLSRTILKQSHVVRTFAQGDLTARRKKALLINNC